MTIDWPYPARLSPGVNYYAVKVSAPNPGDRLVINYPAGDHAQPIGLPHLTFALRPGFRATLREHRGRWKVRTRRILRSRNAL